MRLLTEWSQVVHTHVPLSPAVQLGTGKSWCINRHITQCTQCLTAGVWLRGTEIVISDAPLAHVMWKGLHIFKCINYNKNTPWCIFCYTKVLKLDLKISVSNMWMLTGYWMSCHWLSFMRQWNDRKKWKLSHHKMQFISSWPVCNLVFTWFVKLVYLQRQHNFIKNLR